MHIPYRQLHSSWKNRPAVDIRSRHSSHYRSGKSVCYGCLPLDGSSKKSVAGGTVCACVCVCVCARTKWRTGIRNETAYWSHDNHALRHSMFAQKKPQKNKKPFERGSRPDSLFGRVHVRVWVRDYGRPHAHNYHQLPYTRSNYPNGRK